MMDDRTEHQVIRDLLLQILGELKVANEIQKTKIAFEPRPVDSLGFGALLDEIHRIKDEHQP